MRNAAQLLPALGGNWIAAVSRSLSITGFPRISEHTSFRRGFGIMRSLVPWRGTMKIGWAVPTLTLLSRNDPMRTLRLAARYPSSGFEAPLRLQARTAQELGSNANGAS